MSNTLGNLGEYLRGLDERYSELTELIAAPEILGDNRLWQKYNLERSEIEKTVLAYRKYLEYEEVYAAYKADVEQTKDPAIKDTLSGELALLERELEALRAELTFGRLGKRNESQSVVLELLSPSRESGTFARDLLDAYKNFARDAGLAFRSESETLYPTGGVKETTVRIEGEGARDYLVNESGVHRALLEGGKSATVSVAVYEALSSDDYAVSDNEISIDLFHASGAGGQNVNKVETAVRAKHIPTGLTVVCKDERSQLMNRNRAVGELKERVRDYYRRLKEEVMLEEKNKARAYNHRIRTYDYTLDTVTDLRINMTVPFAGGEITLTEILRMLGLTLNG